MNRPNTKQKMIAVVFLLALLLLIPAVSLAQDDKAACNPAEERLALVMMGEGVDCQMLLDKQAEGYGLGEIMKAWYLAEDLKGFGDWEDLLVKKKGDNIGWGQLKAAARLAGEDADPEYLEHLLELKQSGVGWGQIKKAQAIADGSDMGFDEALDLLQQGRGWDEIRGELGLEQGPPPWAGPKNEDKTTGPPPWANNDKKKGN